MDFAVVGIVCNVYNGLFYGVIHDEIVCYAHFHNAIFCIWVRNSVVLAVFLLLSASVSLTHMSINS
mgnify:CR=1 FL=1